MKFWINAAMVGGREHSFTDDAPLLPVLERHTFTLHSVIDVQLLCWLAICAHMNAVAWGSPDFISAATSPILNKGTPPFLKIYKTVPLPMSCNEAVLSAPQSPWIARRSAAMSRCASAVAGISTTARSFTGDDMNIGGGGGVASFKLTHLCYQTRH